MNEKSEDINWNIATKPLLKKYKGHRHPLEYKNLYQLMIMVILSARSSDDQINKITPPFFKAYPSLRSLSKAIEKDLHPFFKSIRGYIKKTEWILGIAHQVKTEKNIPLTMDELVLLPGIGRKSANVILREARQKAEGIVVDLHVVRVANRLGIANDTKPDKIEKQVMESIDPKQWGEIGMALSFLGRDTCRPTDPKHEQCVMKKYCAFYKSIHGKYK